MKFYEWVENVSEFVILEDAWNAAVEQSALVVEDYLKAYPEDIFIPPEPGKHGKMIDACSAAALRCILPNIIRDIRGINHNDRQQS